jgi:hypothetical protein
MQHWQDTQMNQQPSRRRLAPVPATAASAGNSPDNRVPVNRAAGMRVYGPGGQLTGGALHVVLDAVILSTATRIMTGRQRRGRC